MTELLLFTFGIKPGVLVKRTKEIGFLARGKYVKEVANGILISHKPIGDIETAYDLGVALGYYPPSCERFGTLSQEEIRKGPFLFYNGMHFNTCGLAEEALEWCHKTYGDKIKSAFSTVDCYTYLPEERTEKILTDRRRSSLSGA